MTTITKLFDDMSYSIRGIAASKDHFAHLEIAGVNYHGLLMVERTYDYPTRGAWVCAIYIIDEASIKAVSYQEYGQTPNDALELVKTHTLKWARDKEMETA